MQARHGNAGSQNLTEHFTTPHTEVLPAVTLRAQALVAHPDGGLTDAYEYYDDDDTFIITMTIDVSDAAMPLDFTRGDPNFVPCFAELVKVGDPAPTWASQTVDHWFNYWTDTPLKKSTTGTIASSGVALYDLEFAYSAVCDATAHALNEV